MKDNDTQQEEEEEEQVKWYKNKLIITAGFLLIITSIIIPIIIANANNRDQFFVTKAYPEEEEEEEINDKRVIELEKTDERLIELEKRVEDFISDTLEEKELIDQAVSPSTWKLKNIEKKQEIYRNLKKKCEEKKKEKKSIEYQCSLIKNLHLPGAEYKIGHMILELNDCFDLWKGRKLLIQTCIKYFNSFQESEQTNFIEEMENFYMRTSGDIDLFNNIGKFTSGDCLYDLCVDEFNLFYKKKREKFHSLRSKLSEEGSHCKRLSIKKIHYFFHAVLTRKELLEKYPYLEEKWLEVNNYFNDLELMNKQVIESSESRNGKKNPYEAHKNNRFRSTSQKGNIQSSDAFAPVTTKKAEEKKLNEPQEKDK